MPSGRRDLFSIQDEEVIVDPSDLTCSDKEDVHGVLKDICQIIGLNASTASPGFTWGSSGAIKNAYLQNDTVPSNKSGRLCTVTGELTDLFIITETDTDEYTLQIRRRVGNTFTTIASLVADSTDGIRKYHITGLAVAVTAEDELTAYILKSGNKGATNPACGVVLKGTSV